METTFQTRKTQNLFWQGTLPGFTVQITPVVSGESVFVQIINGSILFQNIVATAMPAQLYVTLANAQGALVVVDPALGSTVTTTIIAALKLAKTTVNEDGTKDVTYVLLNSQEYAYDMGPSSSLNFGLSVKGASGEIVPVTSQLDSPLSLQVRIYHVNIPH